MVMVYENIHRLRRKLGALPSPLWGGAGGGGRSWLTRLEQQQRPPSPTLPHKGGGSTPTPLLGRWLRRARDTRSTAKKLHPHARATGLTETAHPRCAGAVVFGGERGAA